jgi:hypothetical protein
MAIVYMRFSCYSFIVMIRRMFVVVESRILKERKGKGKEGRNVFDRVVVDEDEDGATNYEP